MGLQKFVGSSFRKVRSVLVLSVTVSLLFYYTFQNEIDMLNSYAETELLPQISRPAHLSSELGVDSVESDPSLQLSRPAAARPEDIHKSNDQMKQQDELTNPEVLKEKNKYFPLLQKNLDDVADESIRPLKIQEPNVPVTFKEKYPIMYEISLGSSYLQVNDKYPKIQNLNFTSTGMDVSKSLREVESLFMESWTLYSQYAFGHDEVKPLSKMADDLLGGQAATMIDSLDMLIILQKSQEVERILQYLEGVKFTSPAKNVVKLSENVIHALGGLLSAYQLSEEKHDILLEKAVELGDFLLRAFDTPNRIPLLQFPWNSELRNRFPFQESNIGELGGLSLEFTKLSQLTKDNKYYDAIQRVYRMASASVGEFDIDYLFPTVVDASGCELLAAEKVKAGAHLKDSKVMKSINRGKYVLCQQSGKFKPVAGSVFELYTMDQRSQNFYSTLPKLYHLLNCNDGTEDDFLTRMYINSVDRIKQLMVFEPMLPDGHQGLSFLNSLKTISHFDSLTNQKIVKITPLLDVEHSSCSVGAMMALGGKLFNSTQHLEIAARITNGCFHMYELFGVMPQTLYLDGCPKEEVSCVFKPGRKRERIASGFYSSKKSDTASGIKLKSEKSEDGEPTEVVGKKYFLREPESPKSIDLDQVDDAGTGWREDADLPFFVNGINSEHLLSPDAIESIFYMYRVTGDDAWRQKGVKMFEWTLQAIKGSKAKGMWGVSSLQDVLKKEQLDRLPAHWFSKTLKYYYLLFSDANRVSLDQHVFSSGGHIFQRETNLNAKFDGEYHVDVESLIEPMDLI